MADVQCNEVLAVLQVLELFLGVLGGTVVVQGGEGRGVGADPVITDAHRPAELNLREGRRQLINILGVQVGGEHIDLLQVGELAQVGDEGVHILHADLAQVDGFRLGIRGELALEDGFLRQGGGGQQAQEQHQHNQQLFHGKSSFHQCSGAETKSCTAPTPST